MMLRHPSYVILSMIWICVLATGVQCVKNDGEQDTFLDGLLERARRRDRITRATGDEAETTDDSDNSFLRIASPMRNHKATSGDKVHFKCKVESAANANLTFTWYKEDLLIDPNYDPRVTITKRPWGSRMRMIDLFTYDSGLYRCEASNGVKRVHTSAHLTVSFKKPPPPGKNDKPKIIYQYGKCEKYKGVACAQFLAGMNIYVDAFEKQSNMEAQITAALKQISDTRHVSEECQRYAVPAFCYFVFHPCHANASGDLVRGDGLCSEDCKILKHETCAREYAQRDGNHFMEQIFNTANCSLLKSSKTSECTKIGLPYSNDDCYENDGQHYRGSANVAVSGRTCKSWPTYMANKNPELVGGHNFCRNPGHVMNQPWCYVNDARTKKEMCKISMCSSTNILFIVLPCACALLVIAAIGVYCLCCRRKPSNVNATSNLKVPLLSNHVKVHQVQASSIRYESNIGNGLFGPVLKACLVNEPSFANGYPVAVKVLQENYSPTQLDLFNKELEIFSKIEHNNVACLKAASNQPRCMLFEFSDFPSLHDHLVMHSPANDVTKPPIDNNASHANFVSMSVQVAAGMEYLSTQNFVHRDLAARNVLMLNDGTLKISNLGVVLESNSSSYYKPTQSNQMLPIRWMAPESIHSWQFSDKSAVWSFGVLLWEMFSFGLQPYCGYSNHEVLDMISRRQLLTCPDQCPAKVYSLMHECWCGQPNQRPSFKELLSKLQGWEGSSTTRVTSHLAQGIHRQLTNVIKEGNEYSHFPPQASSVGGSSGITYSSAIPAPTPSPPPQFVGTFAPPCSSASTFMTSQPIPPNVSPSSQQYFSSPATTVSYPNQYNPYQAPPYPPQAYQGNYPPPTSQNYQSNPMQQRRPQQYRQGPPSHTSSSSCTSSGRDQYPPHPRYSQNHSDNYQDGYNYQSRPQPPFSGHVKRPLSGVIEDVDDNEHLKEEYYQNQSLLPQNNKSIKSQDSSNVTSPSSGQHLLEADSSDMSTASAKATSCDSGLPVDDDSHGADPKTPMVSRGGQRVTVKTPQRVQTPRKFT